MSILLSEINEQPAALERALTGSKDAIAELVAAIKARDVRYVILAARGTSDHAATYAKYLLQLTVGIPCGLAAPSVHTLYEADVNYKDALVIGVSQSGAGDDINEVMTQARKSGALTAAITNTEGSKLSQIAEHVLFCHAGVEKAVAATKTYTTTLGIFAKLAARWAGNDELAETLGRVPDAMHKELLGLEGKAQTVAHSLTHAERILAIARGLHLCTAIESSLKIAETTHTTTQAFSSADLLHGPIASVPANTPCLLLLPDGKTKPMMLEVAAKLASRGARVLTLATDPDAALPLTNTGTELLAPLVDILPAQLLAYHLTVARGLDPDNPSGLTKVTVTR
jgi:glucosamine--fructose-6-phosphate aminotransferase (isomerizing)